MFNFLRTFILLASLAMPGLSSCTDTAPVVCTDSSGQPTTDPLKVAAAGIDQLIQIGARLATYTDELKKNFAALKAQVDQLVKDNAALKAQLAQPPVTSQIPQYIIDLINNVNLFERRVAAIVTLPDPSAGIDPVSPVQ